MTFQRRDVDVDAAWLGFFSARVTSKSRNKSWSLIPRAGAFADGDRLGTSAQRAADTAGGEKPLELLLQPSLRGEGSS